MDFIKKLKEFLKTLKPVPKWIIIVSACASLGAYLASCGNVRVGVRDSQHTKVELNSHPTTSVNTKLDSISVL